MSKGRINYYLRYGLVVLITLAFVVATYFIVKSPKTSCEAQGKVADPTPGHRGQCLERCQRDKYRCLTDNCKARWDKNTEAVVCSDCEIGKIPLKDVGTNTYNCVPECTNDKPCSEGETCKHLSQDDTGSPSYCASNLYTCVKDGEKRGFYCKPVTSGSGGLPLNECLNGGKTGNYPCSCNSDSGFVLNNENNGCKPYACTNYADDLKDGPGSDNTGGTCYALDSDGFLQNPNDTKMSSQCTKNKTQEACNNMNKEEWQCKWVPNKIFIVAKNNSQYPNLCNQLAGTKRLDLFPDNNDLSLYALILALLIVAILVFTIRQM